LATTEIVHASKMRELVQQIFEKREPAAIAEYEEALAEYERGCKRRRAREIVVREKRAFHTTTETRGYNYVDRKTGEAHFIERPARPQRCAYSYMGYDRSSGFVTHAQTGGLLASAKYNREISNARVKTYAETMMAGEWRDLFSDPIAITADGHVLNGQHRIAAATQIHFEAEHVDPAFLVIWDVDPHEAQFADNSKRTAKDQKQISDKLITGLAMPA
jgi:hypothetical protein